MDDRNRDAPVVDWSSSPDTEINAWDGGPAVEAAPPPPPPSVEVAADAFVEEEERPPVPALPPPAATPRSAFAAPAPEPQAHAQTQASTAAKPKAGPGRSPLGILAFLALTGYLCWVAAMCYDNLGRLHRQAESASEGEVAALQQDHAATTTMLVLNAASAAPFLLAALIGMGGARRTSQFFAMIGIAAVIYLIAWNLTTGKAYLNGDDMLAKTIMIAVAAWFA